MPDFLPHEAEEFALDHFKRLVLGDLEMLTVAVERPDWTLPPPTEER